MRSLIPKFYYKTIYEIDLDQLWDMGIRGVIVDLDNTLVAHNDPQVTPGLVNWIATVKQKGFGLVIVSNNNDNRVKKFGTIVDLLFVSAANKPLKSGFFKAVSHMGLKLGQVAVVGDQIFTDIWGGNRCGMVTILVDPIWEKEGLLIRLKRILERNVRKNIK